MKKGGEITTFIAFDIETTGLTEKDKIIEFGAALFEKNKLKETFETLINPGIHIPREALLLTGIREEEIKKAPHIFDVVEDILCFISDLPLVAHNAPFDISFLTREVSQIDNITFDTLELSRILLPFITNHKLETLYRLFESEEPNFHRALDDAIATAKVFIKLREFIEKLPFITLEKILTISKKIKNDSFILFESAFENELSKKMGGDIDNIRNFFNIPNNVYEFKPEGKNRPHPPTEERVEEILTDNKTFTSAVNKYEKRKEQVELSKMVMKSFLSDEILISEAGTGTGKTFAYLVPSILWSNFSNERILISTYTKNLEEQLFYKDIRNISNGLKVKFKAVLMKGRNNYLCLKRWNDIFGENFVLLNRDEKKSLLNLVIWQEFTNTGDISENSSFWLHEDMYLWSKLSCDSMDCEKSRCPYFQECYLTKIRKEAIESNIIVINHSLLLSDINMEQKILGEYNRLIIDEAHNLEKTATDFLGKTVTFWQIRNLFDRFYKKGKGLLVIIRNTLTILGKKTKSVSLEEVKDCIESISESRSLLKSISERIWEEVKQSEYTGKLRLKQNDLLIKELKPLKDRLFTNLKMINNLLKSFVKIFEDEKKPLTGSEIVDEVISIIKELEEVTENFYDILSCKTQNQCYWVESYKTLEDIKFVSAPIVIAELLRKKLFRNLKTAVLVSATILVEKSFDYLKEKIGLVGLDRVKDFVSGSSFDFQNQVLVLLPSYIVTPQRNEFFMDLVDVIRKVILATRKGTLILFTSYNLLNRVYKQLIDRMHQDNILLLAQGISGSRNIITKEFKQVKESILLGTYSFWEGLDVPGEALEMLFITKLPFPSPKEPIIEARAEYIESKGMDPFLKLFIPEAVIKLRQGFGRLIRTKEDRGIILILDNRLIKKEYGKKFLNSLPTNVKIAYSEEDFLESIRKFWKK